MYKAGEVSSRVQQLDVAVNTKTKDNVFVDVRTNTQHTAHAETSRLTHLLVPTVTVLCCVVCHPCR